MDDGWLGNRVNLANKDQVNIRQKAYWTQIANYFKDYDEYLLFAGSNEPNITDATGMSVLLSYHQTFINAVRSTGRRNTYRWLVIQSDNHLINVNEFPTDPTPNRIMNGGNNATKYRWRKKITSHTNWHNNVYPCDWDADPLNKLPAIFLIWRRCGHFN